MAQRPRPPSIISQEISPFIMPPPEFNTMVPQGLSAQLARSQATRRSSTKSNTPNSSKRASARITKVGVAGNSPYSVQRRRTTAAHSTRDYTTGSFMRNREQRLWDYHHARHSMPETRPYSWHPASDITLSSDEGISPIDNYVVNAISGLESLAVANTPPSVQQSIQDAFSLGYGNPEFSTAYTSHQSHAFGACSVTQGIPYESYSHSGPLRIGDDSIHQSGHFGSNLQLQHESFPTEDLTFTQKPYLQAQSIPSSVFPTETSSTQANDIAFTPEESGEELVGIGLYDDANERRTPTHARTTLYTHGKDLKLEETWQPPQDDEVSSEEAEEAEELPAISSPADEAHPALLPTYGDLSNQSFFLNDDDDLYSGHDQLVNYLALNNGLEALNQWKTQPAGSGNAMYF